MKLIRIDDRLIHGQVVVGWGNYINPKYIILADDDISEDEMESELYLLGVPVNVNGKVLSLVETKKMVETEIKDHYIILVKSPKDAYELFKTGLKIDKINIGGLHDINKQKFNRYIYVDEGDIDYLKKLSAQKIEISIQDLPTSKEISIDGLLNKNFG